MKKKLTITALIIITLLIITGSLFIIKKENEKKKDVSEKVVEEERLEEDEEISKSTVEEDEIDTSNWKTYRNEEYGFEFKYPEGWEFNTNGTTVLVSVKNQHEPYLVINPKNEYDITKKYFSDTDLKLQNVLISNKKVIATGDLSNLDNEPKSITFTIIDYPNSWERFNIIKVRGTKKDEKILRLILNSIVIK